MKYIIKCNQIRHDEFNNSINGFDLKYVNVFLKLMFTYLMTKTL